MSDTVGHATVEVEYRGDKNFAEVKRISDKAGREAAQDFMKGFNAELKGLDRSIADRFERSTNAINRNTKALKSNSTILTKVNSAWKRLDGTVKLVVASIAGGAQEVAAFGPALGVGVTVLGGALGSLVSAGAVAIGVFSNLGGKLENLPKEVRPAAKAFQNLGDVFSDLRKELQISALADAEDSFESIGKTVKGLTPALKTVATALGNVIEDLARGIAPGTKNFQHLSVFIKQSADDFEQLARIAGTFGEALLTMFVRTKAQRDNFYEWLQDIGDGLNEFANSRALDVWADRADRVFGAVGRLLESIGQTLADLVDEEAVNRLVNFLDQLTEFTPKLGRLLEVLGGLDVFGLLVETLNELADALAPLAPPLEDLFEAANKVIGIAIDEWAEDLKVAADGLAPLVQGVADALNDMDPDTVRRIADALLGLAAAFAAIKGVAGVQAILAGITAAFGGALTKGNGQTIGRTAGKGFLGGLFGGMFSEGAGSALLVGLSSLFGGTLTKESGAKIAKASGKGFLGGLVGGLFASFAVSDVQEPVDVLANSLTGQLGGALAGAFTAGIPGLIGGAFAGGVVSGITNTRWIIEDQMTQILGPTFEKGINDAITQMENGDFIAGLGNYLGTAFQGAWTIISTLFEQYVLTPLSTRWNEFWGTDVPTAVQSIGPGIQTAFENAWQGLKDFVELKFLEFLAGWDNFWINIVPNTVATGINLIKFILSGGLFDWIVARVKQFVSDVQFQWNVFWTITLPQAVETAKAKIRTKIEALVTEGPSRIQRMIQEISFAWSVFWNITLPNAVQNAKDSIGRLIDGIVNVLRGARDTISGVVNTIISVINRLIASVNTGISRLNALTGLKLPTLPGLASGGIAMSPQTRLIGEAGPEAVVPLNRPLSRVDPSVRWLSAIAQGIAPPPGSGGSSSGGRAAAGVTFAPGSIVISGVSDPERAALLTVNRIALRIAG